MWPWRHQQREQVRPEGERLCDGDTVTFPGYPRWTELLGDVTEELPVVRPALVRPFVRRRHGR
jgi:hypothetical protein